MIPVLIPDMPTADEVLPYLRQIDINRQYTNFGPLARELEQRLKAYLLSESPNKNVGSDLHVISVANATLGLEIVFNALQLPKNAHVLVPTLTFPATATAILHQGLKPVFSDIHPDNWLLTPEIAKKAIATNKNIKLIVPVAAFGVPVNVQEWDQFVADTTIPVVIDAAGAFGNQSIGEKVHIVFSLHATKALGGGEGGFIATTDKSLASCIRTISNFGIDAEQNAKIFIAGTNAKLSEYHAAVALASLDRWHLRRQLRVELFDYWMSLLYPLIEKNKIKMQCADKYAYTLLPVQFPNIENVTELAKYLEIKGIQTRRWYYPLLPHHPAFSKYQADGSLVIANKLAEELLGLPFHLSLTQDDIAYIAGVLTNWLNNAAI